MDKSQAIEILTKVTAQVKLTRQEHELVTQALELLKPAENTKEPK